MTDFIPKKYNNKWDAFNQISWNLYKPLSTVKRFDSKTEKLVDPKDILKLSAPIKKGDKVAIIVYNPASFINYPYIKKNKCNEEIAVLTEPILGKSIVKNVLKALERGLNRPIKPGDRKKNYDYSLDDKYNKNLIIYSKIGMFFDANMRMKLIKKYESGKLKPYELLGDHRYFEGMEKKGNILYFYTGS